MYLEQTTMKKLLIIISIFTLTATVSANDGPNWNIISASYIQADIDDLDELDLTGLGIAGSALLGENFVLFAGYSSISDDFLGYDIEVNGTSVGLGYRFGMSETTDFILNVSYENSEGCFDGDCVDDNGYGALVGIKSRLSEKIELSASAQHIDVSGSETALSIAGDYYFTPSFSLGLNFTTADDVNMFGVVASIAF